jgi:hypothetical protein
MARASFLLLHDATKNMNIVTIALAMLLLIAAAVRADLQWKNCGGPDDLLQLRALEYSPSTPRKGQMLNVTVTGALGGVIDQGSKVFLFVKWGLVRIPVPPQDVCKELMNVPDTKIRCPLPPGDMSVKQSFFLPSQIPEVRPMCFCALDLIFVGKLRRDAAYSQSRQCPSCLHCRIVALLVGFFAMKYCMSIKTRIFFFFVFLRIFIKSNRSKKLYSFTDITAYFSTMLSSNTYCNSSSSAS